MLKSCKGRQCILPWKSLHPDGGVQTLEDALSADFDEFYENAQVRVKYKRCEAGYILDAEGPQFENDGLFYRHGISWTHWV